MSKLTCGHLERKGSDDRVSTCISFEVTGPKNKGSRKNMDEYAKHDTSCTPWNFKTEWAGLSGRAQFLIVWRGAAKHMPKTKKW